MKKYVGDLLSVFFIFIFSCILFINLFIPKISLILTPDFGRSDAWHHEYPIKYLLSEELKNNRIPLWTDKIGGGFPIFAEGPIGALFIPNLLLYKLLSPEIAYNISYIFLVFTLGFGMYVWMRLLHLRRVASLFASIVLMTSGPIVTQYTHNPLLQAITLFPLLCAIFEYSVRRTQIVPWLLFSIILSQQIFAGFPQAVFITLLFLLVSIIWRLYQKQINFNHVVLFIVSVLLSFLLSMAQLLPSYEFLQQISANKGFSETESTYFSYPFKHLITMINPYLLGNPKFGTYPDFRSFDGSIFWENTGYIGVVPLILSIIGVFYILRNGRKKSPNGYFFMLIIIISILLMTGKNSPIYFIFGVWPFTLFRVPSRFIFVFSTALIIVSALMVDTFITKFYKFRIIVICLIIIQLYDYWFTWHSYHMIVSLNTLSASSPSALTVNDYPIFTIGYGQMHNEYFLKQGWVNKDPYINLYSMPEEDSNILSNIQSSQIYAGRFLERYSIYNSLLSIGFDTDVSESTISAEVKKYLKIQGTKSLVSAKKLTFRDNSDYTLNDASSNQKYLVYTNQNNKSFYVANSYQIGSTVETAIKILQSKSFIPDDTVLLEKKPGIPDISASNSEIRESQYSNTDREFIISSPNSETIAVIKQTYYPGWEAYIDGTKTKIYPANIQHSAVIIPKGKHTLVMKFQPKSFRYGAILSLVSGVFVSLAVLFRVLTFLTDTRSVIPVISSRHESKGRK